MSKADLVHTVKITTDTTAFVGSEADPRKGYTVNFKEGTCDCPQYQFRGLYCKHQDIVDDTLIAKGKIELDLCKVETPEDKHTTCVFQQVMIDRGYLMLDNDQWKKGEAYEQMDSKKRPKVLLVDSPDKVLHRGCMAFHLFNSLRNHEKEIAECKQKLHEVMSHYQFNGSTTRRVISDFTDEECGV